MAGAVSYRNQSTDLLCKSMDWFLYDNGPRHERVKLQKLHKFWCVERLCYLNLFQSSVERLIETSHFQPSVALPIETSHLQRKTNDWFQYEKQHWDEMG